MDQKEAAKDDKGTVTLDTQALESFLTQEGASPGFKPETLKEVALPDDTVRDVGRIEKAVGGERMQVGG